MRSSQYRRNASAPAASFVRASSGTGKSAGPNGGSASVVSDALVDGRVSLASTLSAQPASNDVPTTRPATAQRRSRTAGGYASARRSRPGTVDREQAVA